MNSLCVDIGASKALIGILEEDFLTKKRYETRYFLNNIEKVLKKWYEKYEMTGAFIATAGPLDKENGFIFPPNLPEDKIQILKPFESLFENVTILNDCHAGVVGEYEYGGSSTDDLLYLTLSTGIGAGVIADRSLISGATDNFAEVGHMKIDDVGKCGCGGIGHWEALCGGKNLPKTAERITGDSFDDAEEIFQRYREGEQELGPVIDKILEYNVTALTNLIHLYNPGHISIGGSMGLNQFDLIIENGIDKIEMNTIYQAPPIEKTELGEEVVLYGLKAICEKNNFFI